MDSARSVGRLIRGLAVLFWALPLALVVSVQATASPSLSAAGAFGSFAPAVAQAVLWYALWLMGGFRNEERAWTLALDRTKLVALVNLGLAPFLRWHQRMPDVPLFSTAAVLFAVTTLLFLLNLNGALGRLSAFVPQEALRTETHVFTSLNRGLLLSLPVLLGVFAVLARLGHLPAHLDLVVRVAAHLQVWLFLLIGLLPVATTMSLVWKIKEAMLDNLIHANG